MTGIYKYKNKINGCVYIGQSINIERRYEQHLYDAKNRAEKSTGIDATSRKKNSIPWEKNKKYKYRNNF